MIENLALLEAALSLAEETLDNQNLPGFMTKRWKRALEKAKERLIEQPFFRGKTIACCWFQCRTKKSAKPTVSFTKQLQPNAAGLIETGFVRRFLKASRAGIAPRFCFCKFILTQKARYNSQE